MRRSDYPLDCGGKCEFKKLFDKYGIAKMVVIQSFMNYRGFQVNESR